jgi:magnesium transporter
VGEALRVIRSAGLEERIFYFYVTGDDGRLAGVVPARKLLVEPLERRIGDVMIPRVLSLPMRATLLEACECFILHRFLAIPVVDDAKRLIGIIDVGLFTDEVMELGENTSGDQFFQTLGLRVQEVLHSSPWRAFVIRFPWLAVTLGGGGLCAIMAGGFASTFRQRVVLSVFLALVLGLSEAVSSQSLALTVQSLPPGAVRWKWLSGKLLREAVSASFLGMLSGGVVAGMVSLFWRDLPAALSIGGSSALAVLAAGLLGVLVPSFLRLERCDPKIAAGPITLALADLFTVACYLLIARLVLG